MSISIIVRDGEEIQGNPLPILKTKKQWRKQNFRKVNAGEKPVDFFDMNYTGYLTSEEIATDGKVTTTKTPVAKVQKIPRYSREQTTPYKRIGAVLLRDIYSNYFVDHAQRNTYLWWSMEKGEWQTCRGYLDEAKIRLHLKEDEIYGVLGGEYTCFSAIDADYHGGDHSLFKDQMALILKNLHGHDGWHYSISPRGVHILRTHEKIFLTEARAELRKLLVEIDAQAPELHQRAVAAGMKPISDWEIYPDPKQSFRLPLARGRVTLLDKPYEKVDLRTYVGWQAEPIYCDVAEAMAVIFSIILPIDSAPPKDQKNKPKAQASCPSAAESVFGKLKGRYAQVLVDFWTGKLNPPDSLNCAIMLTARMMPYYFDDAADAIDFIEELIDGLPDVSFCDRLTTGHRKRVSSEVRRSVEIAFAGNGHQPNSALSKEKLDGVFSAWKRKGFSLIDRSTWDLCTSRPVHFQVADSFSWTTDEIHALTYFAKILNSDVQTTADATRHLLCLLFNHPTGEMTIRFVRRLLEGFNIKCKKHGKVNEYVRALATAGWIEQVGSHVVGLRGRLWHIGERMGQKFANNSSTDTTNPLPHLYLSPLNNDQAFINVRKHLTVDVSEAELAAAMKAVGTENVEDEITPVQTSQHCAC